MLKFVTGFMALTCASAVSAQTVRITEDMVEARITVGAQDLLIARGQNTAAVITGDFAKTARACPPFCMQPMVPVKGVAAVGELELIAFLQDQVAGGTGVLIDARLPEWFAKGSIPGAVNLPFATLNTDNPYVSDIMLALGATPLGGKAFDFGQAVDLMVFCNGAWSDQAMRALRSLRAAGYPADKLHYYRGGMQDWQILGLTVALPATTLAAGE